jgi:hypothetical protein
VIVRNQSASGLGLMIFNRGMPLTTPWLAQSANGKMTAYRPVYRTKLWGLMPRVGLQILPSTSDSQELLVDSSTHQKS